MCEQCQRAVDHGVQSLEALANGEDVDTDTPPFDLPEGFTASKMQLVSNGDGTVTITLPVLALLALLTGQGILGPPIPDGGD